MISSIKLEKKEKDMILSGVIALLPGFIVFSLGALIERSIAASLDSGTVAAIGYGYRLPTAIIGILTTAIGVTVLPYFASMIGNNNIAYSLHSIKKIALILFGASLSLALILFISSDFIIFIFYERGAFDKLASNLVSPIQKAYFMQIPFALIATLGTKTLTAIHLNGAVSILTILSVLLQIILAFKLGALFSGQGIAWATTIGSGFLALSSISFAYFALKRRIK